MRSDNSIFFMYSITLFIAASSQAGEAFEARIHKSADSRSINYRIHMPANMDSGQKYPLVLFLHGAGERGNDNKRQLIHGTGDILAYSTKNNPAIIIAPQCPAEMQWVNTPWGAASHKTPKDPSIPMKLVLELLEETISIQPVDRRRVYVTGLSMGGFGTWDIIQRRPEIFAAAIPICGGGDTNNAAKIIRIPIWAFHGGNDNVVKTQCSRDMINAVQAKGGNPIYTEYPGVGHNSWSATYSDPKVLKWLFEQKK